jgi:hypothetical protein
MSVHVYAVCYNEEPMLPHFLRHYEALAESIIVYDGGSTDRSVDILRSHRSVQVVTSDVFLSHVGGEYSEPVLMYLRNEAYKASRGKADWVMIVDIDEFVHHPRLAELLAGYRAQGITLPLVDGYDMVADGLPADGSSLIEHCRTGFANLWYCKKAVFDPAIDINYRFGCHKCAPAGRVVESPTAEIKLLHYRFLGPDLFVRKYAARASRMSDESRRNNWGTILGVPGEAGARPFHTLGPEELRRWYGDVIAEQDVVRVIP